MTKEQLKKSYDKLLSMCDTISIVGDELLITCPSDAVFKTVFIKRKIIGQIFSVGAKINSITVVAGERRASAPLNQKIEFVASTMSTKEETVSRYVETISDIDLIADLSNFPKAAGAVRFTDNKGLLSNDRIELASAARPNDWQGKNMADYWLPHELSNFKKALLRDAKIENYSYCALLFSGKKAKFTVDARLAIYRGDLVRIVKTHNCEVLE